jgi:selenocysteine lyase/cysteine desulfurase
MPSDRYAAAVASLDVDRARALTPGCEHVNHLNHAGASLAPQPVLDAVIAHLQREATMGGYEAAAAMAGELVSTHASLGRLVGADGADVALTGSGSEAWAAIVRALPLGEGDRVVVSRQEYASNAMALLQLAEERGVALVLVEDDADGQVDVDALERTVQSGPVALVSLVHMPTASGVVNPVEEVGRICRAAGVPFVVDASQTVGQLPLDVDALGCDALVASGRKFLRGPRGTGFLFVRPSLLPRLQPRTIDYPAFDWVAPDRYEPAPGAARFERWEASVAGRLGLGAAADHALAWGLDAIAARTAELAAGLRARLRELPGVTVRDRGRRLGATCTFTVEGVAAAAVHDELQAAGVNVGVSTPSLAQLDLPHRGLGDVVRASVHYVTTEAELDQLSALVAQIAAGG